MKQKLMDNLGLKILAVLFSFLLWLIVVNIDDPVITQPFTGIKVEIQNEKAITEEGKVYEILENTGVVTVNVTANRSVFESISSENIHAIADLEEVSFMNTVRITAYCDKNSDKIENIKVSNDNLKLNIEDMTRVQLVITPTIIGEPANGFVLGDVTTDQNIVRVSGPASQISKISKATVTVDVSGMTSSMVTSAELKLYDAEDNLIDSSNLKKNIDIISVKAEILATKEVPINCLVIGTPLEGYTMNGQVETNPATIVIAGSSKVLDGIKQIDVPDTVLNIADQTANVTQVIDIRKYLPENVVLADETFNGKVTMTAHIEKAFGKTFEVPAKNFTISNVPEGFTGSINSTLETYAIDVVGLKDVVDNMTTDDIKGNLDMSLHMESNSLGELIEGEYPVVVTLQLPEGARVQSSLTIPVTIELNS